MLVKYSLLLVIIILMVIAHGCSSKKNSGKADNKSEKTSNKDSKDNSNTNKGNLNTDNNNSNTDKDESNTQNNEYSVLTITATKKVLYVGETLQLELSATSREDTASKAINNATWVTNNDQVSKVSSDGLVEVLAVDKPLIIEITASVKTASARIQLLVVPEKLNFTAWVGANDSLLLIDIPDSQVDITLYTSTDSTCLPSDCKDANKSIVIANKAMTITTQTLSQKSNYQLQIADKKSQSFTLNESAPFSKRSNHSAVAFSNKIWVIGGMTESGTYLNDVWASSSGETWSNITQSAQFPARDNHQTTAFNNNMYLTGGYSASSKEMDDVWQSENGKDWTKINLSNTFTKRDSHQTLTFKDKLILIGGWSTELGCNSYNDVWQSVDGETWENKNNNAAFSKRCSHAVVNFKDKLYLIGGGSGKGGNKSYLSDVWESDDSLTWTKLTHEKFPLRFKHQVTVFKGAIYLTGGFGDGSGENKLVRTYYNDVWSSADGKVWTQLTPSANFEARSSHKMVVLNDMLYLIGGRDDTNIYNDIWRSNDGINWRKRIKGEFTLK